MKPEYTSPLPAGIPQVRILGSRVHLAGLEQVVGLMVEWIRLRRRPCRQIVVTGFHGLWAAHKDPVVREALNAADLWIPDGIAPVWVARLRGLRNVRRTPGAELMEAFFVAADRLGLASFFYGDTERTLAALRHRLQRRFPGHRVAGAISPPFGPADPQEEAHHVSRINSSGADVLWVGLGLPKQELWIRRNLDRLEVAVAVGVGAALGFHSGLVPRAPAWVGNIGLEWAWRLMREPRKCWRRSLLDGPRFVGCVLLEMLGRQRPRCRPNAPEAAGGAGPRLRLPGQEENLP